MNDAMSSEQFQDYLGLLSRLLRLKAAQREAIEAELRTHLEERFAALTSEGIGPQRAISMALAEFGDAAALAAQFSAVAKLRKRRWMMRFSIGSIAVSLLAVALVTALWPDGSGELIPAAAHAQQDPPPPQPPQPQPPLEAKADRPDPNAETLKKLESLVPCEFHEMPLENVLDFLSDFAEVQTYIDARSLEDVGIGSDVPVTIKLKDVPLEMALRLILGQHNLAYTLDNGVVIITTEEEANSEASLDIRVYRVSDLVDSPPALTDLMDLITSTVEPNTWADAGCSGVIRPYRGALVITQSFRVHQKVEKLLSDLREAIPVRAADVANFPANGPPAPQGDGFDEGDEFDFSEGDDIDEFGR